MEFDQTYDPEPGNMVGPTKQGMEDLIALDPDAHWDESTRKSSARIEAEPARARDPALRPGLLRRRQAERTQRLAEVRQLPRVLHRRDEAATKSSAASRRSAACGKARRVKRQPRAFPGRSVSSSKGSHGPAHGASHQLRRGIQTAGRASRPRLRRSGRHRRGTVRGRHRARPGHRRHPVGRLVGDGGDRAPARVEREPGHLCDCGGGRIGPDPPGDAGRRQRVLSLECGRGVAGGARDGGVLPWRRAAFRGAA